jgi:hypothetical protein
MEEGCVIQPRRQVHQLGTVTTFAQRWVADVMDCCFGLLLICHWMGIRWRRNPVLERVQWTRPNPIIWEKKNLWIQHLRSIDPLKQSTPILLS